MKNNRRPLVRLLAGIVAAFIGVAPVAAAPPQLTYVVIVSRHGVRSPTWDAARLNGYSATPWPSFGVPPGDLTPHGRELMQLMGSYYREWLVSENLLAMQGCEDAGRTYVWADTDQRTVETGKALSETLLPGCGLETHSQTERKNDPLFSGVGTPDPAQSIKAVREKLGSDPQKLIATYRPALNSLESLLSGGRGVPDKLASSSDDIGVSAHGKAVDLDGPLNAGSSLSEDLLLEYVNGMSGTDLGWGHLTKDDLYQYMGIHAIYADLIRRTTYLARARGSNLLEHVLLSLEQAQGDKEIPGAIGKPGDRLLVLVGHDTNLSNLSGMLGLKWTLPGYQPDDTPPGGALIFSLWRDEATGSYTVRTQYVAQTLEQMRNAIPVTLSAPPAQQDLQIPGCDAKTAAAGCSASDFKSALQKAIDPAFVSIESGSNPR